MCCCCCFVSYFFWKSGMRDLKGINQNSNKTYELPQSFKTVLFLKTNSWIKMTESWVRTHLKFCSWWLKSNQVWAFVSCSVKKKKKTTQQLGKQFLYECSFSKKYNSFQYHAFHYTFLSFLIRAGGLLSIFFSLTVANWIRYIL